MELSQLGHACGVMTRRSCMRHAREIEDRGISKKRGVRSATKCELRSHDQGVAGGPGSTTSHASGSADSPGV
eukprot:6200808-Pleurochrysis_carterae.AAC.1